MADNLPNYRLELLKLRSQRVSQEAQIARQQVEIMEMVDRKERYDTNIAAARAAIAELDLQIAALIEAHGDFTGDDYTRASATLL